MAVLVYLDTSLRFASFSTGDSTSCDYTATSYHPHPLAKMRLKNEIIFLLTLTVGLTLTSCEKLDVLEGTPKCMTDKIKELKKQDCPSVETVYQYDFQGQTVYVFNPKNCGNDLASEVTDKDCNNLCWL